MYVYVYVPPYNEVKLENSIFVKKNMGETRFRNHPSHWLSWSRSLTSSLHLSKHSPTRCMSDW